MIELLPVQISLCCQYGVLLDQLEDCLQQPRDTPHRDRGIVTDHTCHARVNTYSRV